MTIPEIFFAILGVLSAFGICAGGLGYLISSYKKGTRAENSEVVSSAENLTNFWKEQADGYKVMMAEKDASWNDRFEKMSREMGELQGQLIAEKKQTERLEAIFKDRNPETEQFMKDTTSAMSQIMKFMEAINKHMEEEKKELHIEATVSKQS